MLSGRATTDASLMKRLIDGTLEDVEGFDALHIVPFRMDSQTHIHLTTVGLMR